MRGRLIGVIGKQQLQYMLNCRLCLG